MSDPAMSGTAYPRPRRQATVREAKALAHPMRQRILRMCAVAEMTNKQLADRLDTDPGTVFYHVKQLVEAGLLQPAQVRTGPSGALEKPYRSTNQTWWISNPLADEPDAGSPISLQAFEEELREAGTGSVQLMDRFMLHLSPKDAQELELRVLAILDEYIESDHERLDQPAHGGIFLIHRLAQRDDA